jgi:hypothetical protein
MLTRTVARLLAAAIFATLLAFSALPAPVAQAAEPSWQRLSGACAIRSLQGTTYMGETNGSLVMKSSTTTWTFYRSGSYYALEVSGTGKFITAGSRTGVAATAQSQNTQNPNSQLWYIARSGSAYTFRNVATDAYLFATSSSVQLWLGNKTSFSINPACAAYSSN